MKDGGGGRQSVGGNGKIVRRILARGLGRCASEDTILTEAQA